MLLSFLSQKLNALSASWDRERAKTQTAADVEARNRFVRAKSLEMLGAFPERNPLSPLRVAVHEREGYRVENVLFQSGPNFWVTGNLYSQPPPQVPSQASFHPVATMHWRMAPQFQLAYLNLVKSGFVVLAYHPIG